jgi:hypothetical protein
VLAARRAENSEAGQSPRQMLCLAASSCIMEPKLGLGNLLMRRKARRWAHLFSLGTGLMACGSSPGTNSPDGGAKDGGTIADAKGLGDASRPPDMGVKSDGGESGAPDGSTPSSCGRPYAGFFVLNEDTVSSPTTFGAAGQFFAAPSAWPPTCVGETVGSCCYAAAASSPPASVSAGTITLTSGTSALATLMGPLYGATNPADSKLIWAPGDILKVEASGRTVDPFAGSVTAPPILAGVGPEFSSAGVHVTLGSDFVVSWSVSSEKTSLINLTLLQGSGQPSITCFEADSKGTLTVPQSLLDKFTGHAGVATIERIESVNITNGNACINVSAIAQMQTTVTYSP